MKSLRELFSVKDISRVDKRAILREITRFSDAQLISRDNYCLNQEELVKYKSWVERLQKGEPLAYILGYKEFYSRKFIVSPATLIPRPETELLVEEGIKHAGFAARILELGTGSGCIAISAKLERADLDITAVDKFAAALDIAKQNAANLGAKITFLQSDWFSNITGKFSLIISNPPYIDKDDDHLAALGYEPISALTDFADGYTCIRDIISGAKKYLLPNGWLLLEHGFMQGKIVRGIFGLNEFKAIKTITDYADLERITIGQL